ncbi:MAG: sensor histidine kinase [Lachnospiraceae bacterium]|nr:sensor histidine kinase [Lachnospiraceae bacterium]
MKRLVRGFLEKYNKLTLEEKIRYSYLLLYVPVVIFISFALINMWNVNKKYDEMIDSTSVASEFSLDFKNDLDYKTYLVIVGNKSFEESGIEEMLTDAERVVERLEKITISKDNMGRLESVRKYLDNLRTYLTRIEENSKKEDLYEENLEIWENDVQIVTTLIEDTIFEYIYYDIKDVQIERTIFQQQFKVMIIFAVIAFVVISAIMAFSSYYIPLSISRPIKKITDVTNQVAAGDLDVRSDVTDGVEATMLSTSLNSMIDKINELLSQVTTEQIRLRKAEFELLQSQINPHFLYNTLDAIVWLAEDGQNEKVVSTVKSLSEFFRTSLNQGKDIVTIKEELQHVKSYLEIQQIRYQDILEYEINVPEELSSYLIPKITIQPLVENALYHGIKNKRGPGKIVVTGERESDYFCIYVKDNGLGISDERLETVLMNITNRNESEKSTFGLYNVNERIKLDFGDLYGISIDSVFKEGTTVSIKLPLKESI